MTSRSLATAWKLRSTVLALEHPLIMGILNVTPDSFFDGGRLANVETAVAAALSMIEAGAHVIDIGGESTRPGSLPVPLEEEMRRVVPVIQKLAPQTSVPISVDTSKAAVARASLEAGAEIVNDVTALRGDPEMAAVVAESGAGVVLMHMRGTPRTMQQSPHYEDVVGEVVTFLREQKHYAIDRGIDSAAIALDPGIGFGKRLEDNLRLLAATPELVSLGHPLVLGYSMKSFIGQVIGDTDLSLREWPTVALSAHFALKGERPFPLLLRVHNVLACLQAVKMTLAVRRAGELSSPRALAHASEAGVKQNL
ncbi:MAG: dihydropteroate synthase [Verrucomicrobiia bacterium]